MPKQIAQPPAPPAPAPAKKSGTGRVFSTKEQEAFDKEADELAASLGWRGPDENAIPFETPEGVVSITVRDARGYLRKIFHEVHQSALTPERDTPEASAVCEHLRITDADEQKLVADAIDAAYEREAKEAPQNPTALPAGKTVNMSAALRGDLSTVLGDR